MLSIIHCSLLALLGDVRLVQCTTRQHLLWHESLTTIWLAIQVATQVLP